MLNIIVLTRPNLVKSATNLILTGLAVSDLLTMVSYLPYSFWYYIVYSQSYYCSDSGIGDIPGRDTKFWTIYSLVHVNFSVTVHSISIWLTVYLACFRYVYIASSSVVIKCDNRKESQVDIKFKRFLLCFRTYKSSFICMILITIFCIIFCSPAYFIHVIDEKHIELNNVTISYYSATESQINILTNGLFFKITFYTQAIFAKLVPCILLVLFSLLLLRSLVIINRNNSRLKRFIKPVTLTAQLNNTLNNHKSIPNKQAISAPINVISFKSSNNVVELNNDNFHCDPDDNLMKLKSVNSSNILKIQNLDTKIDIDEIEIFDYKSKRNEKSVVVNKQLLNTKKNITNTRAKEHLRTTLMLVIVCVLFLIAELPQSILIFSSIILSENNFYERIYLPLGDVMDILALLNNSINFILYCTMSRAFRTTFYDLIMSLIYKFRANNSNSNNNKNSIYNRNSKYVQ